MFEIIRYSADREAEWNEFVAHSKNGTFLIDRRYMDYHADRFTDFSLMFYLDNYLYAILPANISGEMVYSHQGLTYGGLITTTDATAAAIVTLFSELNGYLRANAVTKIVYKAIPWIYHTHPAEEDLYALFKVCNARLIGRDISSTITLNDRLTFGNLRRRGVNKATRMKLSIKETTDIESFWKILNNNLMEKYGVAPVHTCDELELLTSRFPNNIRLFMTYHENTPLGGSLIFINKETVHSQYISASTEGKKMGALDLLFSELINGIFSDYKFFDFGKSTEECGTILNESLIYQKEGFGGRGVCYDTYEWDI